MSTLSQNLRKARALISEPGTNIKNVGHITLPDGRDAFCAQGAIFHADLISADRAMLALSAVLQRRHEKGLLPPPTHSGGGRPPIRWSTVFAHYNYVPGFAIAQFNNSTDQEQVLALFDEAIADAEAAEGDEGYPAAPATPEKPQPEKPVAPEPVPEPTPAAKVRVLELA